MRREDRIGQKFDRWTVVGVSADAGRLDCRCECGRTKSVRVVHLVGGFSRSCGCLSVEITRERSARLFRTHGHGKRNGVATKTFKAWQGMKWRCIRPNHPSYEHYGARGISVCGRWMKFENFLADMGEAPPGLSLDRIDNNGNYEPGNCRWADAFEQSNNRRNNRRLTYGGRTLTLAQWAREVGLKPNCVRMRLVSGGWSLERALATPVRPSSPRNARSCAASAA